MVILHNFCKGVCVGWGFFVLHKFKSLKPMMLPVVQGMWHLKTQFYAEDLIGYSVLKDFKIENVFYYLF